MNFTGAGVSVSNVGGVPTIDIPGGGSGSVSQEVAVIGYPYGASTSPTSVISTTSGVSAAISGNVVTFTFTGYPYPPASVTFMGQHAGQNTYSFISPNKTTPKIEIPNVGGSTTNPAFYGNFTEMRITMTATDVNVNSGAAAARCYVVFRF